MTSLREALTDYLALRRSLGFRLERDEKLLAQFIAWLEQQDKDIVTITDALAWVRLPDGASPSWLRMRMRAARGFAAYLRTIDPVHQTPPPGLVGGHVRRAVPYLYSDADIADLMAQAARLKTPLRQATIRTVIGLLAVTGMRVGEVTGLDDTDFDAGVGLLVVRHAKFNKQRQIPLHPSTIAALVAYRHLRDEVFPLPASAALLVSGAGTRLLNYNVGQTFAKLARRAGLTPRSAACRPRPHDLRHSFAVRTLLQWYRDGGDVAARLPLLSTYLGHVAPANTYWYLSAAPELLAEAACRLENPTDGGGRR
jgi:integrase/recombinase XerD